jgi:hypothetical protein
LFDSFSDSRSKSSNPGRNENLNLTGRPGAVRGFRVAAGAPTAVIDAACETPVVGEIDPGGTRRDGLDEFLDQKIEEGYLIESRTDTHAIISRPSKGLKRLMSGADLGRYVVEVDEDGTATMRPAEPRRT